MVCALGFGRSGRHLPDDPGPKTECGVTSCCTRVCQESEGLTLVLDARRCMPSGPKICWARSVEGYTHRVGVGVGLGDGGGGGHVSDLCVRGTPESVRTQTVHLASSDGCTATRQML